MKIPKEVKDFFNSVKIMAFATSDKNGNPNVVAIAYKKIVDNDTIWIFDTHFDKTKKNLLQNENVSIAMWEGKTGYQIKGIAKYHTEGKLFEEALEWANAHGKTKPTKGVVEIKVTEIYLITPTYEEAGKRVA